jgi:hypothetical protein
MKPVRSRRYAPPHAGRLRLVSFRLSQRGRRWFVQEFVTDGGLALTRRPLEAEPIKDASLSELLALIVERFDPVSIEVHRWGLAFPETELRP